MTKREDRFFTQKNCDRCGGSLENGRIMSMFNTDCICMDCKDKEREHINYREAQEVENQGVLNGNLNFEGIGL